MAHDVTSATFAEVVERSEVPVLVDFWAPWCAPCRQLAPILERAAASWGDSIKVVKVNVDENPDLATRFGIMGIPTMVLFKDGKEVGRLTGVRPEDRLKAEVAKLLG
ncbi:MAG: thioredoxin [Firmicutes bacterium]|nr:thioredoxin [Bacillota bacterium]